MASQYYAIRVVDSTSNRGIPLVYLRTTYKAIYVTDSAGYIAFNEPGLMTGAAVWVTVSSYGYESPPGFFGCPGVQIHPTPGGSMEIRLKRTQIAERLYRMTGYGIYRDSVLLGKHHGQDSRRVVPIQQPVLNAQVAGSDTVQCAEYNGNLLWMWQDTDRVSFELGNYAMTAATTELPGKLNADMGLDFDYFKTDGKPDEFARGMTNVSVQKEGNFPLWVDGLTVVPDKHGKDRLLGTYCAAGPGFACVERGLVLWDEKKQVLERLVKFKGKDNGKDVLAPTGHVIYVTDAGIRYVYYGSNVRVRATFEDASNPAQYEAFTCLRPDGKKANRGRDGKPAWGWVKGGRPVNHETSDELVRAGILRADEVPYRLKDVETGQPIQAHHVGVAWNPFLNLFVNIFQQKGGASACGEIWMSTSHSPEGPWVACRKLATHAMGGGGVIQENNNDLYNPVQHYELMREGGRYVYFSGTFVNTFSGNPWPTPYYNYNNIMYRLDLRDVRLMLPKPPPGLWGTMPYTGN